MIIKGKGADLFDRTWLKELRLDWFEVHKLELKKMPGVKEILDAHLAVF